MLSVSINAINPKLNDFFGKRASLTPQVLKSFALHKDSNLNIIINDFNYEEQDKSIVNHILRQNVDIISFSAYIWSIEKIIRICSIINDVNKNSFIVLGGPGAAYTARDILYDNDSIDMVISGEGEEFFFEVIQHIKNNNYSFDDIPDLYFRKGDNIIRTEHYPPPRLETHYYIIDTEDWNECSRVCYETSRGCVMKCKFCLWYKAGKVRYYPMEKVKTDLDNIFSLEKIQVLEFVDADININPKRSLEIFRHVRTLNDKREKNGMNRVSILYESNPEMFNDDIINEMTQHDRILDFGLQTVDEQLQQEMGRIYHPDKYFNNLEQIAGKQGKRHGEYMLEIICGLPGDSLEGYKKTIRFILSLPYMINFWSFIFLFLPGSIYRQEADKYEAEYRIDPPYEIFSSNTWTENDLEEAKSLGFNFFFIQYAVPTVYQRVKSLMTNDRLLVCEAIFNHYKENYPELSAMKYKAGEEVFLFQACSSFENDESTSALKRSLEEDGLRIINDYA